MKLSSKQELETSAAEHRTALCGLEGNGGLHAALRTGGTCLGAYPGTAAHTLCLALLAVLGIVLELFVVEEKLLARSEDELGATVIALQNSVGKLHGRFPEKGNFDDPNISISPVNPLSTYLRKDQKLEKNKEYSKDKLTISIKNKNADSKSNSEKCIGKNKDLNGQHFLKCIEKIKTEMEAKHHFNFSFFSYLKNKIKSIFNLSTDFEGKRIILLDQIYQKEIDIEFIFKKIQDIEKLKLILLDDGQRKLFDLMKPSIITSFGEGENGNFNGKAYFSKTDHLWLQNGDNKEINDVLNIYEQKIKNNKSNLSEIDEKILNCFN